MKRHDKWRCFQYWASTFIVLYTTRYLLRWPFIPALFTQLFFNMLFLIWVGPIERDEDDLDEDDNDDE